MRGPGRLASRRNASSALSSRTTLWLTVVGSWQNGRAKRGGAMFRRALVVCGLMVVGAAGVGAAAVAVPRACPPGSPCAPPTNGSTSRSTAPSTTTAPRTTTAPTTTGSTSKGPKPIVRLSGGSIEFGASVTVSGRVPRTSAGKTVEILSQACGFTTPVVIAKVKTHSGGTFAFTLQPARNTRFGARAANAVSAMKALRVRPKIELRRVSGTSFEINVAAGAGVFFTKAATIEIFSQGHWKALASGALKQASEAGALVALSSAKISATAPAGAKLRASAGQDTVGQCYQASRSVAISSSS